VLQIQIVKEELSMAVDPPIGSIMAFAGPPLKVPSNYLVCDGRSVAVGASGSQFNALFQAIGTSWGGDGVNNFNIPDLRGLFLRGVSQDSGNDPDADSRTAIKPGGHAGNQVGSLQSGDLANHGHNFIGKFLEANGGTGFFGHGFDSNSRQSDQVFTMSFTGGKETRPINANVLWIIRIS
jgi:microcystin-dependent protein